MKNKKDHVIISGVISRHMGRMYIETPYITFAIMHLYSLFIDCYPDLFLSMSQ